MVIDNPCTSTSITIEPIPKLDFAFNTQESTTHLIVDTDTASQNTGKDSLCGARLYEIMTSNVPYVVVDPNTGFIQVHTTDINYIGTLQTIEIKVSLVDYPTIVETS